MAKQYKRGFTTQAPGRPEARPPKIGKGTFNPMDPTLVRSALMSPPTRDTQEPRLSRWEGGKNGKNGKLTKGKKR